jgi:hypothetical protein
LQIRSEQPICCKTRRQAVLQTRERSESPPQSIDPAAALRGFFAIMQAWGNAGRVPMDTLRRIGYLAGIYKALEILYSDPHQADDWVKRPNQAFGGQTPLARMRAGDVTDLAAVRSYLDAARAPWS